MTTPEERRRNLLWGREMLEELAGDDELSLLWRKEAATLLAAFPPVERIEQGDASDLQRLQADFASPLIKTMWLFMKVQADRSATAQRKCTLKVILRHFQ